MTAQLPRDTLACLVSPFLICVDRVTVSHADKGWRTALRAPKWEMTPCRGVGCVREGCVGCHCVDMRTPGPALRALPVLDTYKPNPDDYDSPAPVNEAGLAEALLDWARVHLRPLLNRPLTMLKLPSIARPAVILSYLAEVRAQITVVYFSSRTAEEPDSFQTNLFLLSHGVLRPNQAVNLPPQQGIAAIIVGDDWSDTAWPPILKHVPRLQYLSTAYGPTRSDLAEALALVPNVRFLDVGRYGGILKFCDDSGKVHYDHDGYKKLLRHAGNIEVLRCSEGIAFQVHVVQALKRSCCPRLREAHVDEDQLRLVDDPLLPWDNEKMPILLPGCDGVVYKDPKEYPKKIPADGRLRRYDSSDNDSD